MALPQAKQDAARARIDALAMPQGGWSRAAREAALSRLQGEGLPARRDEYWRFTNPADLNAATPPEVQPLDTSDEVDVFDGIDMWTVVFRDGRFDAEASDDGPPPEGVTVERLADIADRDIHWARDLYGVIEGAGQSPVSRPHAALNTAFATDGLIIDVTAKPARPICVRYLHEDAASDAILHHVVRVHPNAAVTILEAGAPGARFNTVMESDVAEGGVMHHVRDQGRVHGRRANAHAFARLGAEATYKSFTLSLNGALTRNEHVVTFTGDDATAHVAGAAIGDGAQARFHHDDTVFVTHDAVNCESRQVYKKVLRNGAVGVFQGKILVQPGAQKTDGYQISQSLLLDDDSQFLAKPELEIYADDVACSHGSTTGAIDEEALFYLRARGVDRDTATDLLVLAFLAEALDEVEDSDIAETLRARLERWLARHAR